MSATAEKGQASRIFRRLAWLFAGGLIAAQAALLVWNLNREYHRTLDVNYARLADAARIADENITGSLRAVDLQIKDVIDEVGRSGATNSEAIINYMTTRSRGFPESRTILMTNANGIIIATTRSLNMGLDVHDRPFFINCRDAVDRNHTFFSPLFERTPSGVKVVFASHALLSPSGEWIGVVAVAIEARMFDELLASIRPDDSSSSVHLVGIDGRVISRAPDPDRFRGYDVSQNGHYAHHIATGQKTSFNRLMTVTDKIEKISAVRTIADGSYVVVVQTPIKGVLAPWYSQFIANCIIFFLLSMAVLGLTWLVVRRDAKEQLARASAEAAREALQASEEEVRLLLQSSGEGIFGIDRNGSIVICNPIASQMLGFASPAEVLGKNSHSLCHHHRADGREYPVGECHIHRCAHEGLSAHVSDEVFFRSDESSFPVEYRVNPITRGGTITGAVVTFADITERRRLEEAHIEAKHHAEAADRAKSEFLAMMSHELRTPLNSILGFSELIRDQSFGPIDNPQYIEYADYIYSSGQHLLHLLNDILDLAKIEAGKMAISLTTVSIGALLDDCNRMFRTKASAKGISFSIHNDIGDIVVLADERAIRQMLFNFISNAIKFTDTGGVTLRAKKQGHSGDVLDVFFEVLDTGIGISGKQQKLLFKPFMQLAETSTRRFEGSGLGLVITHRLTDMMGGTIGVESEFGKGSRFWFSLPLRIAAITPVALIGDSAQRTRVITRSCHILVAEDNPINQMLVRSILRKGGHTVEVVDNGHLAVEAVTSRNFDLILMDMQMPVMSGEDATRLIRKMPPPKNFLPIIALTADAMLEHRERYLAAGVNTLVAKPVDVNTLLTAIETHSTEDRAQREARLIEQDQQ